MEPERTIVQLNAFTNAINNLMAKKKISTKDFDDFKKVLVENPKMGTVITGTGGVRKTRLKSISKGKRGGFRVCYLDIEEKLILFLIILYPKNEKEDLS